MGYLGLSLLNSNTCELTKIYLKNEAMQELVSPLFKFS